MAREMKNRPAMEIGISGMGDGEHPFAFDVPAQKIGLDESFRGDVKATGVLRKVSTQYFVNGEIETSYDRECDRCLVAMHGDVHLPLALYYRIGFSDRHADDDAEDVDVITLAPDEESIVLDDDIRQVILLSLPLKMLCRDDCRGLCPQCGADLNSESCRCEGGEIDPRWAKLAEMLNKKNEN